MKRKVIIVFGYVLLILLCWQISFISIKNPVYNCDKDTEQSVVGEIIDGSVITQEFNLNKGKIIGIDLRFATYAEELSGVLGLQLISKQDGMLVDTSLDLSKLRDNQIYTITFDEPITVIDDHLTLKLMGIDTKSGNSATVYAYNSSSENTMLKVNGNIVEGKTLNLNVQGIYFNYKRMVYLCVTMALLYTYILFVLKSVVSTK